MKTKKFLSLLAAAILLSVFGATGNAQPLKFLGLEMGVDRPPFPRCTPADSVDKVIKRICWIGKPYTAEDGEKLGAAYIPNEAVPDWAVYATFNLHVTKKYGIRGIGVNRGQCTAHDLDEIIASISARFGPSQNPRTPPLLLMRWENKEGYVQLFASESSCKVDYRTPELQDEVRRQSAEREKEKQARPKMP